ncbi:MAG: asparagine synthetase B, partial [Salinibacter sp.]
MTRLRDILLSVLVLCCLVPAASAQDLLIPMDEKQNDHLKAYGAVYAALQQGQTVDWLLNYRGGSFLTTATEALRQELRVRGVTFSTVGSGQAATIISKVEADGSNMAVVPLEKAPKIAVYAPDGAVPWDDAVRLALKYADVPHDVIYDKE